MKLFYGFGLKCKSTFIHPSIKDEIMFETFRKGINLNYFDFYTDFIHELFIKL